MSRFLINLVRRGAGLETSVVPRAAVDSILGGADAEGDHEVAVDELPSDNLDGETGRKRVPAVDPVRAAKIDDAPPDSTDPSPQAFAERAEIPAGPPLTARNAEPRPPLRGTAPESPRRAATPALRAQPQHRRQDSSTQAVPRAAPALTPDAEGPAVDDLQATGALRVEPVVESTVIQERYPVEGPIASAVMDGEVVSANAGVRPMADVPPQDGIRSIVELPTGADGAAPRPEAGLLEESVARPPEIPAFQADVEKDTGSVDRGRQIDQLLQRLEAAIDRLESTQTAGPPPLPHVPRRRAAARGFGDLAAQRRHVDRRWY